MENTEPGQKRRLLVITGFPASGKSIASELCRKRSIPHMEFSEALADFMHKTNLAEVLDLREIGLEIRRQKGNNAVAVLVRNLLEKKGLTEGVLIGARSHEEIEFLSKYYETTTLAIVSDRKVRYSRWISRGKSNDPRNEEECQKADAKEIEMGIEKVVGNADIFIENNGSIAVLKKRLSKAIEEHSRVVQ